MTKKDLFYIDNTDIPSKNLDGKYCYNWIEETIGVEDFYNESKSKNSPRDYLGKSIKERHILYLFLFIAFIVIVIIGRIFILQIVSGAKYREQAEGNRIRLTSITSERGAILDSEGRELVQNIPNFSLAIVPQDLPSTKTLEERLQRKKIIKTVVELSGVKEEKINRILDKYGSYSYASLVIEENLDYEKALLIYINSTKLPGIQIVKGNKRKYNINSDISSATSSISFSHMLGYLGKIDEKEYGELKDKNYLLFDNIGKTGLEKQYETKLRGKYGLKKVEVDASGHDKNDLAVQAPVPGNNLILSVDYEAQVKLENALKTILTKHNKEKGAAIAMDPRNGSIIALVSWPSFDNNDFSGGIDNTKYNAYIKNENRPLYNRAISGTYPSGSTIKMIMTVAALQEGIITPQTTFLSSGGIGVGQWFFADWLGGGHGVTNATKALAWSVNTFYYYIGGGYKNFTGLGVNRIVKYFKMFNLASVTNIDIPGEQPGFLPSKEWKTKTKKEPWYVGDTYNLSIGQGDLLVTPLQVAVWTSAIANGGYLVKPRIVDSFVEPNSHNKIKNEIVKTNIDVNKDHILLAQRGMRQCVTDGSCQLLQYLNFAATGKTGTAQWNTNNKQNHAWFTAFAPYDSPKIVVTVLIEEGEGGATTAMPVAYDFLNWWGNKYLK